MDNVDKKIVLALRKNARILLTELGQFINLSIPAVRTRYFFPVAFNFSYNVTTISV
jgi:hypothetical protein